MRIRLLVTALLVLSSAARASAQAYVGDFAPSSTVDCQFTTVASDGAPTTLTSGTVSVYKDNGTTESTAGVTLTASFDTRTGYNHVRITTSSDGTFYSAGSDFHAVLTAGTVSTTSVVGYPVCHFSLNNRSGLRPATDGRTLNVSAGGVADATVVSGGISSGSFAAGAIDASAIATDAIGASELATDAIGSAEAAASFIAEIQTMHQGENGPAIPTATVTTDAGNSTTQAETSRTESVNDYWKDTLVLFGGTCNIAGQVAKVTAYNGTTKILTWSPAKTATPDDGCTLWLINR